MQYNLRNIIRFIRRLKTLDYLIIIALILSMIVTYQFFNPQEQLIDVEIMDDNIPIYLAYALKKGDTEKNPTGKTIAELKSITIYDITNTPSANKNLKIEAKILVRLNQRNSDFEYKNKIVKIGTPIELKLDSGLISGTISNINSLQISQTREPAIVTLKMYEQWPWFAENINVGAQNIDENGQKLIEVLEKDVRAAEVTVDTASGERVLRIDPQKVDITLKVRMFVQKFGKELVFKKDRRIVIGEQVSFNIDKTLVLDAHITKIE